jgi:hypothetical protein
LEFCGRFSVSRIVAAVCHASLWTFNPHSERKDNEMKSNLEGRLAGIPWGDTEGSVGWRMQRLPPALDGASVVLRAYAGAFSGYCGASSPIVSQPALYAT